MLDILLGSACFFLPPQAQAGVILTTFIIGKIRRHQKKSRSGKDPSNRNVESVEVKFSAVTCTLKSTEGLERKLLDDVHGEAKPGRILAIFGPSGSGAGTIAIPTALMNTLNILNLLSGIDAGKTTLLNVLAGQLPYSPSLELEGYVTANGEPMPSKRIRTGFVAQEDLFFSQMTVREVLNMAAELRTNGTTQKERDDLVESVIRNLGLLKCADTIVGDAKTRGLSGGEKKRLSIACEMIGKPQIIMADEPTSGLDAFAAQQVVTALKKLALEGKTVIISIHQPRSSIFAMLDDLCLLSEGRTIYFGPCADALPYFESVGFECPVHFNPAEFLADSLAIDHSTPESEKDSMRRVDDLAAAWKKSNPFVNKRVQVDTSLLDDELHQPGCSIGRQVLLLLGRSWKQIARDKATLLSRASSSMSSALVFSTIYWRLGKKQPDIQSRLGLLQVSAVGTAMTSLIKTLNVFPQERTIVQRERSRAAYPVFSYFASKLAAELPVGAVFPAMFGALVYPTTGLSPNPLKFAKFIGILIAESFAAQGLGLAVGAAAPSTSAALAIGPAVILVSIVFGGLFVNVEGVPKPLKWIPKTSLIKHAFEGACINEFRGLEFDCGTDQQGRTKTKKGEDVLAEIGADTHTVKQSFVDQGRVILMYWWIAYRILKKRKPRYMQLQAPKSNAAP